MRPHADGKRTIDLAWGSSPATGAEAQVLVEEIAAKNALKAFLR
jgi:hypothetical protein